MRRCPTCHWINHDQDHYCRRCNYFLRRQKPLPLHSRSQLSTTQQVWRFLKWFPWGGLIVSSTILGVMGWAGYWGWQWTQPMLNAPPSPDFAPALPLINTTIAPSSPKPSSTPP